MRELADPLTTVVSTGSTTPRKLVQRSPTGRLCLVVIGEGLDATYPLPDTGTVGIGRAPDSDVRIDHPSVSRGHALLSIGESTLTIQDLGSANGTRIRDRWLAANASAELSLGEPIDVGSVMVVVQQRSAPPQQRHIWAHGYFEARLDEECARAQRSGARFSVIRIHCGAADRTRIVEDCLCRELRAMDVIGYYGPTEHEVMLLDIEPAEVAVVVGKLTAALAALEVAPSIGVAHYPADARNPYELLSRASAAALGQPATPAAGQPLVIANVAIQNLDRIVQRIATGTISVLVTGETGVGKEVLAERIHRLSRRADQPFLRLNSAALSESLLESELFGHEKGSFTGAVQAKAGLLETADGGTVFLDEIGEMPMSIQVKLLRVIEERQVMRVGALKSRYIDVRFLAATNRDLEAEIIRGTFRQDLYFRLAGITLVIPPLRERISELPELAAGFLRQLAQLNQVSEPPGITPAALALLCRYSWPGNIRELRNVMERALLLGGGGPIDVEHLPLEKMRRGATPEAEIPIVPAAVPSAPVASSPRAAPPLGPVEHRVPVGAPPKDLDERARIVDALGRAGGNQTEAARLLGISRRTLINRVIQLQIPRPRKK